VFVGVCVGGGSAYAVGVSASGSPSAYESACGSAYLGGVSVDVSVGV
jgi:hypothetical protein